MTTALVPYRAKPTLKQRLEYKLAHWAWLLGLKRFED